MLMPMGRFPLLSLKNRLIISTGITLLIHTGIFLFITFFPHQDNNSNRNNVKSNTITVHLTRVSGSAGNSGSPEAPRQPQESQPPHPADPQQSRRQLQSAAVPQVQNRQPAPAAQAALSAETSQPPSESQRKVQPKQQPQAPQPRQTVKLQKNPSLEDARKSFLSQDNMRKDPSPLSVPAGLKAAFPVSNPGGNPVAGADANPEPGADKARSHKSRPGKKKITFSVLAEGLNLPRPGYPEVARRWGLEGTVRLEITISKDGEVLHVTVKRSSGHSVLDKSAMETVESKWSFNAPGRKVTVMKDFTFQLQTR